MKTIVIFLLTISLISCHPQTETLTDQNKEQIIGEIKPLTAQILEGSETVDMIKAHEPYADSPDFIALMNGRITDFAGFQEGNRKYFESLESQRFISTGEKYTVLNKETVIVSWTGSIVTKRKDGQTGGTDHFSVTIVFAKRNGQWKVVYTQEAV